MRIGVESIGHFGDCLFNTPLIKALAELYGELIDVAVFRRYADAFSNLDFINRVIELYDYDTSVPDLNWEEQQIGKGIELFEENGYDYCHQITQYNTYIGNNMIDDVEHFLIPQKLARDLGTNIEDIRPIFIPTKNELSILDSLSGNRYIAIEPCCYWGHNWISDDSPWRMVDRYFPDHKKLWLSNTKPFGDFIDLSSWSRRSVICTLLKSDFFISVSSGFFCASIGLRFGRPVVAIPKDVAYITKEHFTIDKLKLLDVRWVRNINEFESQLQVLSNKIN